MDMTNFWQKYVTRMGSTHNEAELKRQMLMELEFDQYLDPAQAEAFYNYMNRLMTSFANFSHEKAVEAYVRGKNFGKMNNLNNTQKSMLKQQKYTNFEEEVDSIDGPSSGDQEGFEESFVDINGMNAAEEFKQVYGQQ